MQIVSSFLQLYSPFFPNVYSCFLRVSGRTCSSTIVLSRCQEVKFIFSIISGQTAQTEENDVWGQMLKTWVLCSLNSKSKELKWKADNVTVFLYGDFYLEERWEWKEDGFQVPTASGSNLALINCCLIECPWKNWIQQVFNWITPQCQALCPHRAYANKLVTSLNLFLYLKEKYTLIFAGLLK